ncbi:MAG: type I methionyl aminopeptidase [Cytophagales bacterium]|nr:type I methionyl aminopeptidase [Armatimonadota bacterium]
MKLKTENEIAAMREAGKAAAASLIAMREAIVPGETTTLQLDEIAGETLAKYGAKAALNGYKPPFSKVPYLHNTCISVNDEIIHGVPRRGYVLHDGDIVGLDLVASVDGWCADSAITVPVGSVSDKAKRLLTVTREALHKGIAQAKAGNHMGDVGSAIQRFAEQQRCGIAEDLVGHGVGVSVHEPGLDVPNRGRAGQGVRLLLGMTFAIEPMLALGKGVTLQKNNDPWTVWTKDHTLAAHFEHTVAITENGPLILTLPAKD